MRILYFSRDYTTHDRRFLAKMAESPHEILFLRLHDDGAVYEKRGLPAGVRAIGWNGITGAITPEACLARMPAFVDVLREVKPDLIHAGPIPTCGFMVALAEFRPLMCMSWGSDVLVEAKEDALLGFTTRFALARSDAFVVDCDAVREEIRALTHAGDERFVQLPWGLELARFPRHPPRKREGDEIVVLSTRSWDAIYGIDTALEAFRLARLEDPRLRLSLLGDGPLALQITRSIETAGLRDVVRRPGRIPEDQLDDYFSAADVYLSCAKSDGTSVSLMEAMAYGLPVVATNAPGNREWVTHDRSGWLAPAGDATTFAQHILRAARLDDAKRAEVADYNRDVVERRADWHVNSRRLLAAYDAFASAPRIRHER